MKSLFAALGLAALIASPALGQSATQAITDAATKAATDAATKAATDTVEKTLGTGTAESKDKTGKDKKDKKDKKGPNHGNSADHRMDGEKKGHGKDKK